TQVLKQKGEVAKVGEVIGYMDQDGKPAAPKKSSEKPAEPKSETRSSDGSKPRPSEEPRVMPAAERALAERGLRPEQVTPTGPGGRLLKEDVLRSEVS